jgi:hypothetical protein
MMPKGTQTMFTPEQAKAIASLTPTQRQLLSIAGRSVRRRSEYEFLGMPLYAIASGPDPARNEIRGHAKGVIAIGDVATGVIAIGGWARGIVAIGGLATGLVSVGGLAIGFLAAFGGFAASAGVALGGGAVGTVALGGGAAGYYAAGGAAAGTHVVSPMRRDREAEAFFAGHGLTLPSAARTR